MLVHSTFLTAKKEQTLSEIEAPSTSIGFEQFLHELRKTLNEDSCGAVLYDELSQLVHIVVYYKPLAKVTLSTEGLLQESQRVLEEVISRTKEERQDMLFELWL